MGRLYQLGEAIDMYEAICVELASGDPLQKVRRVDERLYLIDREVDRQIVPPLGECSGIDIPSALCNQPRPKGLIMPRGMARREGVGSTAVDDQVKTTWRRCRDCFNQHWIIGRIGYRTPAQHRRGLLVEAA
jgi:hypothetical protein